MRPFVVSAFSILFVFGCLISRDSNAKNPNLKVGDFAKSLVSVELAVTKIDTENIAKLNFTYLKKQPSQKAILPEPTPISLQGVLILGSTNGHYHFDAELTNPKHPDFRGRLRCYSPDFDCSKTYNLEIENKASGPLKGTAEIGGLGIGVTSDRQKGDLKLRVVWTRNDSPPRNPIPRVQDRAETIALIDKDLADSKVTLLPPILDTIFGQPGNEFFIVTINIRNVEWKKSDPEYFDRKQIRFCGTLGSRNLVKMSRIEEKNGTTTEQSTFRFAQVNRLRLDPFYSIRFEDIGTFLSWLLVGEKLDLTPKEQEDLI